MVNKNKKGAAPRRTPLTAEPENKEVHHHYYKTNPRRFDFGKLSLGLFLLLLGLLYLAKNTGWLNFNWEVNLWQLWPLLIIFAGLSLITGRTLASIFAGTILTLTVLTLSLILIAGQANWRLDVKTQPFSNQVEVQSVSQTFPLGIERSSTAQTADILLKTSLSDLTLSGGASKLLQGNLETNFSELVLSSKDSAARQIINLETRPRLSRVDKNISRLNVQLNSALPTNLYLDSAAANCQLDLTATAVNMAEISLLASNLRLTLSALPPQQNFTVKAKTSAVNIILPKEAGVKIIYSGNQKPDLPAGWEKISNSVYQTANYAQAKTLIELTLDLSLSSLTIN